jgi:(p)ppGpp synthase/HD superfamily hydrolase
MIYTEQTKKAIKIMFKMHQNQVDKANTPYVFHPWHVAENQKDETRTIVALLHDVVEDTDMTLEDIKNEGFSDEVVEALSLLTHQKDVSYYDYIVKIGTNPIAIDVKIADLKHNSDLSRLTEITQSDFERADKYKKCIIYLEIRKKELETNEAYDTTSKYKKVI